MQALSRDGASPRKLVHRGALYGDGDGVLVGPRARHGGSKLSRAAVLRVSPAPIRRVVRHYAQASNDYQRGTHERAGKEAISS